MIVKAFFYFLGGLTRKAITGRPLIVLGCSTFQLSETKSSPVAFVRQAEKCYFLRAIRFHLCRNRMMMKLLSQTSACNISCNISYKNIN